MTEKILLKNGTHSLVRFSGEICRIGGGRSVTSSIGRHRLLITSIQIRDEDGRINEIKDVTVTDYLESYLSSGQVADFYFRQVRYGGEIKNLFIAVKTKEIAIYDEYYTNPGEYPISTLHFAIALLISLPFSFFTLMLLSPISGLLAIKLISRSFYQGSIPSHKVIAGQVKKALNDEGFTVV